MHHIMHGSTCYLEEGTGAYRNILPHERSMGYRTLTLGDCISLDWFKIYTFARWNHFRILRGAEK